MSAGTAAAEQQVTAIDGMNQELADTQANLDAARAEAAELKRKYEPESGVIAKQMFEVTTDHEVAFLHVMICKDERLYLELVPDIGGHTDLIFASNGTNGAHLDGYDRRVLVFTDTSNANSVLVHFDADGVRFDVVDDVVTGTPLTIKEFRPHSSVTLSTKRRRTDN